MNEISIALGKFARQRGLGASCFKLQDGSNMHILSDLKSYRESFYREKDGMLVSGFHIGSSESYEKAINYLKSIRQYAINPKDADDAWIKSHTFQQIG